VNKATVWAQPWSFIHSAFILMYYLKCFRVPQSQKCVFGIPVLYSKDKTFTHIISLLSVIHATYCIMEVKKKKETKLLFTVTLGVVCLNHLSKQKLCNRTEGGVLERWRNSISSVIFLWISYI